MKGLVTRYTHVKYESPISHCSLVMTKVKNLSTDNNAVADNRSQGFSHSELKYSLTKLNMYIKSLQNTHRFNLVYDLSCTNNQSSLYYWNLDI